MYTETLDPIDDREHATLAMLASSWNTRVAVRRERLDLSGYCDPARPDFPIAMVPFWTWPELESLDEEQRRRLLGAAWIVYNEKTINAENDVIAPACFALLRDEVPGASRPRLKEVIAQTQVDEQFHVLMCLEVCLSARQRHRLPELRVPRSLFVARLESALADARAPERGLVRLAYATVAEMTINAFLRTLSVDETIQPLNRLNTDLHRRDESAHALIFREIAAVVFGRLRPQDRATFNLYLTQALRDINEPDLSGWEAILHDLPVAGADDVLARLREAQPARPSGRDHGKLLALLDDLGNRADVNFDFGVELA